MIDGAKQQPNAWTCGPTALRNAMLVHGYTADVRVLASQSVTSCCNAGADTVRDGRCEHGLQTAAREHGFTLDYVIARDPGEAYVCLREWLPHAPLLLCVEHYSHWITAVKATSRHVFILDPARNVELHQRLTHRQLLRRMSWGLPDEVVFHLYPLRLV